MPPYGGPCHGGASRAAFFFESRRTDGEAENRDCPCFPPIGPAGRAPVPRGATASRRSGSAPGAPGDRKSVVEGKSVSVRVDLGGRRIIKKKTINNTQCVRAISNI